MFAPDVCYTNEFLKKNANFLKRAGNISYY